ncbi:MAG: DNA repair protein [Eubacteriales bacterium]|nr:DNA repair protein [Eubacteriales bacterium]
MTDQELRKLSRADLLELLLRQSKENEQLREQLKQAQEQLASREIKIDNAGSIAEAALQLNGVFEAAEQAAAQYLENVRRLAEEASQ